MKVLVKILLEERPEGVNDLWVHMRDGSTLKDLVEHLEAIGLKIDLSRNTIILVNGRHADYIGGLGTCLNDLDEVVLMHPPEGG